MNITSEFNEVYFSERRNFEATRKIPTSKNKFGRGTNFAWQNSRRRSFRTVKFLLHSPPVTSKHKEYYSDGRKRVLFSFTSTYRSSMFAEFWRISSEKYFRHQGQTESPVWTIRVIFFILFNALSRRKY